MKSACPSVYPLGWLALESTLVLTFLQRSCNISFRLCVMVTSFALHTFRLCVMSTTIALHFSYQCVCECWDEYRIARLFKQEW